MKYYAHYLIPGMLFPEEATRELDVRSVELAVAKAPASAYCFTLYETADPPATRDPDYDVTPRRKNESKRYYLGGRVFTPDEVKEVAARDPERHYALVENMEGNGWTRMIKCRPGNWQPFEEGDTLIEMEEAHG